MDSIYEKVGRTAFVIAEWRTEESESADPLFIDHLANIFLNNETHQVALSIAKTSPSTKFLVRYRTRYFDDAVLDRIHQGTKQFLILGSGLDTRPMRFGTDGVKVYEVEQQHVLDFKAWQLKKFGYRQNSVFVPCDYTDVDFILLLNEKGFDPERETFVLWEGNIFYLTYENICHTLESLNLGIEKYEIAFDYLSQKLITSSTGFKKSQSLLDGFSSIGAPWNTGFDDIAELAGQVGMTVSDNFLIADYANNLNREFQVDLRLFDDYSISILNKT